ncbi:tetratricopeptide repeat protein 4-like isoform X2 [Liolophura sinensis]|uniref:tetratricopeptide repeat protein 4-like isoform X2 n=1 Tax=Liolophura sinensis TaxID=3198878 RepID=UPI0031591997
MNKEEKINFLKSASEEERKAYFRKMDEDLEAFIMKKSKAAAKKRENEPEEKNLDEVFEELQRHPAFVKELDFSKPLHPLVEGLIDLKYNSEDAKEKATNYKEEGNRLFKEKKYRLAIDNYTEGIQAQSNLRTAINNCIIARKFVPEHKKAIYRGCVCSLDLKKYEECLKWCDLGLALEPGNKSISDMRVLAEKLLKVQERDRRKELAKERRELNAEKELISVIQSRGVKLGWVPEVSDSSRLDPLSLTSLESHHPSGAKVHLDDQGVLNWPVLFMYPEHTITDFIEAFRETDRFVDHLNVMFGPDVEPAPWDADKKYTPESIEIYFEDKEFEKLYQVDKYSSLQEALRHDRYRVHAGTPAFILIVSGSKFREVFLSRSNTGQ